MEKLLLKPTLQHKQHANGSLLPKLLASFTCSQRFLKPSAKFSLKSQKFTLVTLGWLLGFASPQTLQESHLKERLFQNFVIMELRKSWIHNGKRADFYFYRDSNFREIDLLIKNGNVYHPIAISTAETPESSLIKTFNSINRGNVVTGPGSVICLTDEPHFIRSDVVAHSIFDI